jgi:hypothetical protein
MKEENTEIIKVFLNHERIRIANNWGPKKKDGFKTKEAFVDWYIDNLKRANFCCHYCGSSIFDIRSLIEKKFLKGRNTRGGGIRGLVLEVDRKDNDESYNPNNCVLACYLCNNDKSSVVNSDDYLKFMGEGRKKYIEHLLKLSSK